VKYMHTLFPNHIIIEDVGSGINFNRKGLQKILELANEGTLGQVVVAYRDRLTRFGFSLIEQIITKSGGKLLVLNNRDYSKEEEMVEDILSIITVFTARINGLRKYKTQIEKDKTLLDNIPEGDNEELVWDSEICI